MNDRVGRFGVLTKMSANSGSGASCAPTVIATAPMVPVVSMANDRAASGEFITMGKCSATKMTHSTTEATASIVRSATICKSTGFQFGFCVFHLTLAGCRVAQSVGSRNNRCVVLPEFHVGRRAEPWKNSSWHGTVSCAVARARNDRGT